MKGFLAGLLVGAAITAVAVKVAALEDDVAATRQELNDAVADLRGKIQAEKEEAAGAVSDLQQKIDALQAQIDAGNDFTAEMEAVRSAADEVQGIVTRAVPEPAPSP